MYDIVEKMNLEDHPKSIFTTGEDQTKVRTLRKANFLPRFSWLCCKPCKSRIGDDDIRSSQDDFWQLYGCW